MQASRDVLSCTAMELAFLAGLKGADTLVGIPDPFRGWLAGEVEEAWAQCRPRLVDRGLLTLRPDGGIAVNEPADALVQACGFPDVTFTVTRTSSQGESTIRHYHVARQQAVELVVTPGPDPTCTLTGLDGVCAVLDGILDAFRLTDREVPCCTRGIIPEAKLSEALSAARSSGASAAQAILAGAGLDAETAACLGETISHPVANGALVLLTRRGSTWDCGGFGLLEGGDGYWILRSVVREEKPWVQLLPSSAEVVRKELTTTFQHAVLAPVEPT